MARKVRNNIDPKLEGAVQSGALSYVLYTLAIILVMTPLLRGTYFTLEQLIVNLIICAVFFVYLRNEKGSGYTAADIFFGIFIIVNILVIIWGANTWMSVQSALKYFAMYLIFIMGRGLAKRDIYKKKIMWIVYLSGIVAVIATIAATQNIFHIAIDLYKPGRIYTVFQYPNTGAIFLGIMVILGYYLHEKAESKKRKYFLAAGNILLLICMFGTQSKGGLLAFFFILILYLIFNLSRKQWVLPVFVQVIFAAIIGDIYLKQIIAGKLLYGGLLLIAAMLVNILIYEVFKRSYLLKRTGMMGKAPKVIAVIVALLVIAAIALNYDKIMQFGVSILAKISNIKVNDSDTYHRLLYYKDSLKLIINSHFLGYGGNGWESTYFSVRSLPYFTRHPHNNILTIFIETGIIGLVSFILPIVYAIKTAIKERLKEENVICLIMMLGIFTHALIDFDFSYGAITILFWLLIGIIDSDSKTINFKNNNIKRILVTGNIFITIVLTIFLMSIYYNDRITQAQQVGDSALMKVSAEKAAALNPFAEKTLMNLANFSFSDYTATGDRKHLDNALKYVDRAIKYDRFNSEWYFTKANYLAIAGDVKAEQIAEDALKLNRYGSNEYTMAINVELMLIRDAADKANSALLASHVDNALHFYQLALENEKEVPPDYSWRVEKPSAEPYLNKVMGYIYLYMKQNEKAKDHFDRARAYGVNPMEWADLIANGDEEKTNDSAVKAQILEAKKIIELYEQAK